MSRVELAAAVFAGLLSHGIRHEGWDYRIYELLDLAQAARPGRRNDPGVKARSRLAQEGVGLRKRRSDGQLFYAFAIGAESLATKLTAVLDRLHARNVDAFGLLGELHGGAETALARYGHRKVMALCIPAAIANEARVRSRLLAPYAAKGAISVEAAVAFVQDGRDPVLLGVRQAKGIAADMRARGYGDAADRLERAAQLAAAGELRASV